MILRGLVVVDSVEEFGTAENSDSFPEVEPDEEDDDEGSLEGSDIPS